MADTDPQLGMKIHDLLRQRGIETPMFVAPEKEVQDRMIMISRHVEAIMMDLRLNMTDDSLRDTPRRVAKMFCEEIFGGLNYDNFPKCTAVENKFPSDEVVLVRDIVLRSTCEHHLQPIYGRAHIGYIAKDHVLGLSKFSRVTEFFAARPQVQERLTEQLHLALCHILETSNVAVVIHADHYCMKMRGVKDACASTVTSKMTGRFRESDALRGEFFKLLELEK